MRKSTLTSNNLSSDFALDIFKKKVNINISGEDGITVEKRNGVKIKGSKFKKVFEGKIYKGQSQNLPFSFKNKQFFVTFKIDDNDYCRNGGVHYCTDFENSVYIFKLNSEDLTGEIKFSNNFRTLTFFWSSTSRRIYINEIYVLQ